MAILAYRIRIRNAADTADDLVLSSLASDPNPYIIAPPTGDGQKINIRDGSVDVGAYQIEAADPSTAGYPITSHLADAQGRQQYLSRRSFIDTWDGAVWTNLVAGFVQGIKAPSNTHFVFTTGDTRRIEQNTELFKVAEPPFDNVGLIIGGPIRQRWGTLMAIPGWKMRVNRVEPGKFVEFRFQEGWIPDALVDPITKAFMILSGSNNWHSIPSKFREAVNDFSKGYFFPDATYKSYAISGAYPRLIARVETESGTFVGTFQPLAFDDYHYFVNAPFTQQSPPRIISGAHDAMLVEWFASQPTVGQSYRVMVYAYDITPSNPLHVQMHPVDLLTTAWDLRGIAYDATDAASTRDFVGAGAVWQLRPTKSVKLSELETAIFAFHGIATRNVNGVRHLVPIRIRKTILPAISLDNTHLREETPLFDLQESTVTNKVIFKQTVFSDWQEGSDGQRPVDAIVTRVQTIEYDNGDITTLPPHDITFEVPEGSVWWNFSLNDFIRVKQGLGANIPTFRTYTKAAAEELLMRLGRGDIQGEIHARVGAPDPLPGDEIYTTFSHQINGNIRGGTRVIQIISRTITPDGIDYVASDSGTDNQPATTPTFTAAKDTASDPRRFATITLTNIGAIAALSADARIRMEWATGGSAPSGDGALLLMLNVNGIIPPYQFTTPRTDTGATLWFRARTEIVGMRPGLWSAWTSVALDAPLAPSGLTVTPVVGDGSLLDVAWTAGEGDMPVEVKVKLSADAAYVGDYVVLPPGSTRTRIRGRTPGTSYDVLVRVADESPYGGTSSSVQVTGTVTNGTTATLNTPQNPRAFAGYINRLTGVAVVDGTFGLEVQAIDYPTSVAFEMATETAVGSNTPGTFMRVGKVTARQDGPTRFEAVAPNDRKKRYLRAYETATGYNDSPVTASKVVDPYSLTNPVDEAVPVPGDITANPIYVTGPKGEEARIAISFTPPNAVQYIGMEYWLRSRPLGATTFTSGITVMPGTKNGPDLLPVRFATEYEVTPVTISEDGTRNVGAALGTVVVAARTDPTPSYLTPVATSTDITYGIASYDNETKRVEVWSAVFAANPGTSSLYKATGATKFTDFNYGDGVLTQKLPIDATNPWRKTTFAPFDKDGNPGPLTTFVTQRATPTLPGAPGTPTAQSNPNPFTGSVTVRVPLHASAVAGWKVRLYRNASPLGSDRTLVSGDITAGYVDIVDSTVSAATAYSYTATHLDLSSVESVQSSALSLTTFSGGTLSAATFITVSRNNATCNDTITWGDPGNPSGTVWELERNDDSTGWYGVYSGTSLSTVMRASTAPFASEQYRVRATKTGYTSSSYITSTPRTTC